MDQTNSQRIGFLIAGVAAALVLCNTVMSRGPYAADTFSGRSKDSNLILFQRGTFDTRARADLDTAAADSRPLEAQAASLAGSAEKQLRVVQLEGPVRREWIDLLKRTGSEIIGYIPNNAYIVRGTAGQIAEVSSLHRGVTEDEARPIRWMGYLDPLQKLDSRFNEALLKAGEGNVRVDVELLDSPEAERAMEYISAQAVTIDHAPRRFLKFVVISATIPIQRLLSIARLDEVLFVSPAFAAELHDERSAQITAANLIPDRTAPTGPGYLAWLGSKGLNIQSGAPIDFTDTGLDRGSISAGQVHPDFRDSQGNSRVVYYFNYAIDSADDRRGHGSLVASVACGSGASGNTDEAGYLFGLGIDPATRLGVSRIFAENGNLPFNLRFTDVVSAAYNAGARISNNSWGNGGGDYDVAAQEYDALVRDAQPAVPGNQQMLFVFSAGNSGPGGHISSPGIAKNVITVGASENFRPQGWDSCNLDGLGVIGPDGADSALDVSRFSSGGPTHDRRAKPDIIAPGSHIYGVASRAELFNGNGICPGIGIYQPPGQSLYTWSSGTSLAAPHVTGAASLLTRYFVQNNLLGDRSAPSPAMVKACLINSSAYLTGENGGDNLPGDRQGWGLVDLTRTLASGNRILIDQTKVFGNSGESFDIRGSIADRTRAVRVTLAWTDAPGMLAGAALANDLDLELKVGDTTIFRGNHFSGQWSVAGGDPDSSNNIEAIYLPPDAFPEGAAGNFKITVRAANVSSDGVPGNGIDLDQDFALVVDNMSGVVIDPPPQKNPVISTATYVKKVLRIQGSDFTAAAQVEINGRLIDREFTFDASANALSIKLKSRKLHLNVSADNQVVLIENNKRSLPFILRL